MSLPVVTVSMVSCLTQHVLLKPLCCGKAGCCLKNGSKYWKPLRGALEAHPSVLLPRKLIKNIKNRCYQAIRN